MVNGPPNCSEIFGLHFGHDDHCFFTLVSVHTESNDIACPHAIQFPDGAFNIFGEDIAAPNDNDIFYSAADNQFSIQQICQIASA